MDARIVLRKTFLSMKSIWWSTMYIYIAKETPWGTWNWWTTESLDSYDSASLAVLTPLTTPLVLQHWEEVRKWTKQELPPDATAFRAEDWGTYKEVVQQVYSTWWPYFRSLYWIVFNQPLLYVSIRASSMHCRRQVTVLRGSCYHRNSGDCVGSPAVFTQYVKVLNWRSTEQSGPFLKHNHR